MKNTYSSILKKIFFSVLFFGVASFANAQDINMSNGTFNQCSGNFYDSGGQAGNYSNDELVTLTIYPDVLNLFSRVTFNSFDLENGFDYLTIWDGPDNTAPLIGDFTGLNNPGTVTSTHPSGSLTIQFYSNGSIVNAGWEATISCAFCTVYIPDANFKAALVSNDLIDTNFDDEIQCSEASAYTGTLNVSNLGISDLTGIDSFTSISGLDCSNNNLSQLIINSANSFCTFVNCSDNQLIDIGLYNLTSLSYLNCDNNFNLTYLPTNPINSLTELYCNSCNIPDLFLSNFPNLSVIDCSFNGNLVGIDASNNPFLTILYANYINNYGFVYGIAGFFELSSNAALTTLSCEGDTLTSLNLSNNPNLVSLNCNSNYLTTLNIQNGNNSNFIWFEAGTNGPLSCIQVDDVDYMNANWSAGKDAGASFSTCCSGGIVNIPDANFKTALLANASINTNFDTEIQCSEASVYGGFLNVNGLGISDLTGIEAFINIDNLNCSDNQLGSLDLSSNINLEYLYCGNNLLTSLNVSENSALINLDCSNNDLSTLDVSSNSNLTDLNCGSNNLSSLDLSANTVLINVNCTFNNITNLDVFALTNLVSLDCYQNGMTSLNTFLCTNLASLKCEVNNLTSIDLSTNNNISILNFYGNSISNIDLSNLTNLQELICINNPLTSLDLSSNPNLASIYASISQLTSLDLSNNPLLTTIECASNSLLQNLTIKNGNNGIITSFNATNNPLLTCIEVSDEAFMNTNFAGIGNKDAIASYNTSCACVVNIPDANFKTALLAIPGLDSSDDGEIQCAEASAFTGFIDVSGLNIADLTGIEAFTSITELYVGSNQLTSINLTANTSLLYLYTGFNQLTSIDISTLVNLLEFDCSFNVITNINLSANSQLTWLDVSGNQLTSLNLNNNVLLDLLQAYENQITSLDVSNNPVITTVTVFDNNLSILNLQNGNNTNMTIAAFLNPPLTCIQVDDIAYANTNWSGDKDPGATFSLTCECLVSIPDANFKTALLADLAINTNADGEIQCNEASAYTGDINVAGLGITDMTGIEAFTALTSLTCSNNNLGTLDLSANVNLTGVLCRNDQLTSILLPVTSTLTYFDCSINNFTTLDFSNLSDLETLGATNCGGLTSINVSNNPLLNALSCDHSSLTSLDVSGNPLLGSLVCYQGQIPSLNLSANTLLTNLECSNNLLSSLDLSANTALTYLDCSQNSIENIDLSSNTLLNTLGIGSNQLSSLNLANQTSLINLFCFENPLSSLDVTSNTLLQQLDCNNTSVGTLDVSNNPNLYYFRCIASGLTSLNMQSGGNINLTNFFATSNPLLTCIQVDDVDYMNTNWSSGKDAGASFSTNCNCTVNIPDANFKTALLAIPGLDSSDDGEIQCAEASAYTGSIDVSGLGISDLTGIEAFTSLTGLICQSNNLSSINTSTLPNLTLLDCSFNNLSSIDLSNNILLTTIGLRNNNLSSIDITQNTLLTFFGASHNNITSLDLSSNSSLQSLDIGFNAGLTSINVSNLLNLQSFWCESTAITTLDLSNNSGINLLALDNSNIASLDLSNLPLLSTFSCTNSQLANLNLASGNNSNLFVFVVTNNPNLTCIQVSDVAFMNTNFGGLANKDAIASYSTSCGPCFVNIPDANFKAALVGNLAINTNADSEIQCAEASAYTGAIDVSNLGIVDMTGLEAFVNATSLNCALNDIVSLDASANVNLATLWCQNNNSITSVIVPTTNTLTNINCGANPITTLDISGVPNLETLTCSIMQLTSLDLSNNSALTYLDCSQNQLASLNVSNLSLLDYFDFGNNQISSIDLSSLTIATTIKCSNNLFTGAGIDVTNNIGLLNFYCNGMSSITNLDLTNNVALQHLEIIDIGTTSIDLSNNINLTYLDCFYSSLTSLDVSSCVNINHIRCFESEIANININGCTNLAYLNAGDNPLVSLDLSTNTSLQNLNCLLTSVTSLDLSQNSNLTILLCQNNSQLTSLNIQNGNNNNLSQFNATGNPALTCIQVDNVAYMNTNWSGAKDAGATYSTVCPLCVVNIPDANFKAALLSIAGINTNSDAEIQCSEASAYTGSINVVNLAIADLTGIEAFVNLTQLDCRENLLTTLNVSSNPALLRLYCGINFLTSLNVTNNLLLEDLYLDSNQVTSIDVSANLALKFFYCDRNQISTIDISGNPLIEGFYCYDNLLTSLNMQNGNNSNLSEFGANENPLLTCIQVDDATFMNTNWSGAKDAGATYSTVCPLVCNVNIPDAAFKAALLANAAINTNLDGEIQCSEASAYNGGINVSASGISDLTGIEAFVLLSSLDCSDNSLTTLNLSANTALGALSCSGNLLTNLDLSSNTQLGAVFCLTNNITNLNVTGLTLLSTIKCLGNQLTSLDLSTNIGLVELECSHNQLTSIDLSNNTNLQFFYGGFNPLTSVNFSSNVLLQNFAVQSTLLSNLDVSVLPNLLELLVQNGALTSLKMDNGVNNNLVLFNATNNPSLTCIQVDDATFMNTNWAAAKDAGATYSVSCGLTADFVADVTTICQNGTVNFSDLSTGTTGGTSYLWDFGDGNISTTVGNVSHIYSVVGTYTVSLTVTDGNSNTKTLTNYITVNPIPLAPTLVSNVTCGPTTVEALGVSGTLTWSDGGSGNPRDIVFFEFLSVTQTVGGCISALSNVVNVFPESSPPNAPLNNSVFNTCDSPALITAVYSSPTTTYLWSNGETTQDIVATTSGNYFAEITNICGTTISENAVVQIDSPVINPILSDSTRCGGSVLLTAGHPGATYLWSTGSTNQTLNVNSSGNYFVQISNFCGGYTSNTASVQIDSPIIDPVLTDLTQCGGSVPLDAGNPGATYLWSDASTNQILNVTSSGIYSVTVGNSCGATSSNSANIVIGTAPVTSAISGSATPNCSQTGVVYSVVLTPGSSYNWSVPSGAIITSGATGPNNNSISVDFAASNGNIQVTETNSATCVGTAQTLAISLQGCGLAADFIADATTICQNGTVNFSDLSTGTTGGTTYLWDFGDLTTSTTVGSVSHTYLVPGTFTVSLTVTDGSSNNKTLTNYITVNPSVLPSVSSSASATTICAGTSVTFSAAPTNGGITPSYQWYRFLTPIAGEIGATYTSSTLANFDSIWVEMTSSEACASPLVVNSNGVQMTVNSVLVPSVANAASATTICTGTSVTFTATPTNEGVTPSYQWYRFLTPIAGETGATYTSSTLANFDSIWVEMTSSEACASPLVVNSNGVQMTVNSVLVPSVANAASATTICAGTSVTFTAAPTNEGITPSYQWYRFLTPIAGETGATYTSSTLVNFDSIWVEMTSSEACASPLVVNSNGVQMIVNSVLVPSVANAASATTICAGTSVTFTATPTNGGITPSYQWYRFTTPISGETGATYTSSTLVNFDSIWVEMTSSEACASPVSVNSIGIQMNVSNPLGVVNIGGPYNQCGGNVNLDPGISGLDYVWSNGSTNQSINVTSGNYTVDVTNICGTVTSNIASVQIDSPIIDPVLTDLTQCGGSVPLDAGNPGATYLWTDGSTNQILNVTTSGIYSVTVGNSCGATSSNSANIVIGTAPVTSAISGSATPNCSQTGVVYSVVLTPGSSYNWSVPSGAIITSGATGPNNNSISVDFAALNGNIQVTETNSATCIGTAQILAISLQGCGLAADFIADATTICQNGTVNFSDLSTGTTGGTTYLWDFGDLTTSTTVGSVSHTYLVPGTFTVSLTVTDGSSNNKTLTNYITVNPSVLPSVSSSASASTICAGTSVTFTATPTNGGVTPTYQWKSNGLDIAGETNATYTSTTLVNLESITVQLTSSDACASPTTALSNAVVMTVNSVLVPSVVNAASQTAVCTGASVTFTATPTNGGVSPTYQWKSNGLDIAGETNATYTSTTLLDLESITVQLTSSDACASPTTALSNAVVMTVNSVLVPSVVNAASQTAVCTGASVTFTATPTNGGVTPTYQWKSNGLDIVGETNATYTSTTLVDLESITVELTSSDACASPATALSNAVVITVNSVLVPSVVNSASQTAICNGASVTFTATPTNGGVSPTYQWKSNGLDIAGETNATYTSATLVDLESITVQLTSSDACASPTTALSNAVVMTVNSVLVPSVVNVASQTAVCTGASVTFTATPTNGGVTPTYQWKSNGLDIVGETNATYTSTTLVDLESITVELTSSDACAVPTTALSNAVVMTVNSVLVPSVLNAASQTSVCTGASVTFTATPTNGGVTPTYQWKSNGLDIAGETNATYTSTTLVDLESITVELTSSDACAAPTTALSNAVVMTVNSVLVPSVVNAASQTSVCSGASVTFTATPTNGGVTPTYQWKSNGLDIVGETNVTYTSTTLVDLESITVELTSSDACAAPTTALSNAVVMTVNSVLVPSVANAASQSTICNGASVTFTATPTNGGVTPSYQWKSNGLDIAGETNATYTSTTLVDLESITVELTSSDACAAPTTALSNAVVMTVNSVLVPSVVNAASQTSVCTGASVTFTATPTNGGVTPSYQWKSNGLDIVGETNATYTSTTLVDLESITVELTSSDACAAPTTALSNAVVMTVNSVLVPSVVNAASQTSVCTGASVTFTATPTNGGVTPSYQWKSNGLDIAGETNATYTSTTLVDLESITVELTSSDACAAPTTALSNAVVMTVNSVLVPSVANAASQSTICNGASVTFTATPTNGGVTPSYQWKSNGLDIAGETNATYTSTTLVDLESITVELTSSDACAAPTTALSNALVMTVNSVLVPSVVNAASQTSVCTGASVTFTATPTNGGVTPTYQWKSNGLDIAGETNATYTSTTLVDLESITVELTSSAACAAPSTALSNAVVMTVNSVLVPSVVNAASQTIICTGTSVTFTATPTNGGVTPAYQWKSNGVDIVGETNDTYTTTSLINGDIISVLLTSSDGCASPSITISNGISMTVNPILTPAVSINASQTTICSGASVTFTASPNNGGLTPTYQWKLNGVDIAGETNASYTTSSLNNSDVVSVELTSSETCVSPINALSAGISMVVNNITNPSISISANQQVICSGKQILFSATAIDGGNVPGYQWQVNGVNIGANSPIFSSTTLTDNSTVSCVLISSDLCPSAPQISSNILNISVNPSDFNPEFTVSSTTFNEWPFEAVFTNNTPNPTNYSFTWYFGDGVTSTQANPSHTFFADGSYTVTLVAQSTLGCTDAIVKPNLVSCTNGQSNCSFTTTLNYSGVINGCEGGTLPLIATTTAINPLFQWTRDGEYIGGATQAEYIATVAGTYNVIVFEGGGCPIPSPAVTVNFDGVAAQLPTISQVGELLPCVPSIVTLTANNVNGASALLWNTGQTTNSIDITQSGFYTVRAFYGDGCNSKSLPYSVNGSNAPNPGICIVTVDTVTLNNIIVWERPSTTNIDSFYVYRETSVPDIFTKIGAVDYDSLTEYEDASINIQQQGYRYMIASLDTCGGLSLPSVVHKTIHVKVFPADSLNRLLSWSAYEGRNFDFYQIIRTQNGFPDSLIAQIPSTQQLYVDENPPSLDCDYKINIILPNDCVSSLRSSDVSEISSAARSRSHSNQNGNNIYINVGTGIKTINTVKTSIRPNPSSGVFTIELSEQMDAVTVEISDIFGKEISRNTFSGNQIKIDMNTKEKGVYLLRLKDKKGFIYTTKVVIN
jgi:Leucine-rich repeat (LRR) protein/PKD repeat protein